MVWLAKRAWCYIVGHDPRVRVPAVRIVNLVCARCDSPLGMSL